LPVNKIVAHYSNGAILKGATIDFFPNKPVFHLIGGGILGEEVSRIWVDNLKGVFFVKSYDGNRNYNEIKEFVNNPSAGKRIKVKFKDGEVICGYTHAINFENLGFFVVPIDPKSNNERIFAIFSSIKKLETDYIFLLKRVGFEKNQDLWDKFF